MDFTGLSMVTMDQLQRGMDLKRFCLTAESILFFTNSGFDVIQHAAIADQKDGRFPSDHLPVAADIEFVD